MALNGQWMGEILGLCKILDNPVVIGLQFHVAVPCLLVGTLWLLSGKYRSKNLQLIRKGKTLWTTATSSSLNCKEGKEILPKLSVILPVGGLKSCSCENWKNILGQGYLGPIEFIFVTRCQNSLEFKSLMELNVGRYISETFNGDINYKVRIVVSGMATACSQKIHNLLEGIKNVSEDSKYIIFLDDDVTLQPDFLTHLVRDVELRPNTRLATGYPFDIPAGRDADIFAYAALSYHLPLVIGFSLRDTTQFVWGGCMLFRSQDLRDDEFGIQKAWRDGGYSDDLIVASIFSKLKMPVYCPPYAIFPQWVDVRYSFRRYWNYLRRQLYVLDTYANLHNRCSNYALAVLHCYGSWGFCLPVLFAAYRIMSSLVVSLSVLLMRTSSLIFSRGSSPEIDDEAAKGYYCQPFGTCSTKTSSSISFYIFLILFTYMAFALWWMTINVMELLAELNPDLSAYHLRHHFEWKKLWIGFFLANLVLPLCLGYTFLTRHIEWANIRYWRHGGRIIFTQHRLSECCVTRKTSRREGQIKFDNS